MPRHKTAKETSQESLRREINLAKSKCQQEEDEISDAETLDSNYETVSTEAEDSYESDFIDDSEIHSGTKWNTFDIRSLENATVWRPYQPQKASKRGKRN